MSRPTREYMRAWRLRNPDKVAVLKARAQAKRVTPEGRAQRRAEYQKVRVTRNAALRQRYASDPEYREQQKAYSRNFYKVEWRVARLKELNKKAYLKNAEKKRAESNAYYHANLDRCRKRNAERRAKTREKSRAWAHEQVEKLTDCYVREQLAKSLRMNGIPAQSKDFPQWSVELKRQQMIAKKELLKYEEHERTAGHSL